MWFQFLMRISNLYCFYSVYIFWFLDCEFCSFIIAYCFLSCICNFLYCGFYFITLTFNFYYIFQFLLSISIFIMHFILLYEYLVLSSWILIFYCVSRIWVKFCCAFYCEILILRFWTNCHLFHNCCCYPNSPFTL